MHQSMTLRGKQATKSFSSSVEETFKMMTFKLLSLLAVLSVLPFVQAIELQSGLALSFYACSNNSYVTGVTSNDVDGFTCSEGDPVEVPLTNIILSYLALSCRFNSDPIVVGFLTANSENTEIPQLNSSTYFFAAIQGFGISFPLLVELFPYSHVPICASAAYLNLAFSESYTTTFKGSGFDCLSSAWTSFDSSTEQVTCTNVTQSTSQQTLGYYACPNNSYVTNVTSNDVDGFTCSEGDPVEVTLNGVVHSIIFTASINSHFYDSIVIGFLATNQSQTQFDSDFYFKFHTPVYTSANYLNLAVSESDMQIASISDGCSSSAWVDFDTVNNEVYCVPVTEIPTFSSGLSDSDYLVDNLQYLECPYGFFNSLNESDGSQCEWNSDAMPVIADIFIDAENVIDTENGNSTLSCGINQAALRILGNYDQDAEFFTNLFNDGGSTLLCANVQLDSNYSLVESQNITMDYDDNDAINFNCTNVGNYTSTGFLKSITQQTVGSVTNYFYTCLYLVPAANTATNSTVNGTDGSGNVTDGGGNKTDGSGNTTDGSSSNGSGSSIISDGSGNVTDGSNNTTDGSGNVTDGNGYSADCSNPLASNGNGKCLYGNSNQYKQGSQQNQGNYGNYNQGSQQNQQNSNYGNYNQVAQQNQQNSNYGNYNQGAQQNCNYGNCNQLSKLSASGIASLLSDAASINVYLFATLAMSAIF